MDLVTVTPRNFLVWGAGGHGSVVAEIIRQLGFRVAGFVGMESEHTTSDGSPVAMTDAALRTFLREEQPLPDPIDAVALAIGHNQARLQCASLLDELCAAPLIHPRATVSQSVTIERGTVICAGAIVNPGTSLGVAVIANSSCVIEHDCMLQDGVHVSPGAVLAGGVHVGTVSWIGANATVLQGLRIGRGCIVGAGAVVTRDVPDNSTVLGNPARPRP